MDRNDWLSRRALMRAVSTSSVLPLALAACVRSGAPAAGSTSEPEAQPATVQFYFNGDQPTAQLYANLKEVFERTYPKYTLSLVHGDTEIEQVLIMLAAGTPPDVFWNRVPTSQTLIRREGSLVDLLPLMKRDKLTQDDFWPSAVAAYTYKGGYFGLPTSATASAFWFNKEHFRQAGLTLPTELEKQGKWNWDAVVEAARKLTGADANGKKRWGYLRVSSLDHVSQFIWQSGGKPFSDDRTQCLLGSPEAVAGVQYTADMVLKHQVTPPVDDPDKADFHTNFLVSMDQTGGRNRVRNFLPAVQAGSLDVGAVVIPAGPKKNTTRSDDLAASIIKATRVPDAAWAFSKLWASDEGQLLVLKSNRSYTSRRSIAKDLSILKQALVPYEDPEVYYTGLSRTEVFPVTPKFTEVIAVFDREILGIHKGEKAVKPAMDAAAQQIAPLLKEPF